MRFRARAPAVVGLKARGPQRYVHDKFEVVLEPNGHGKIVAISVSMKVTDYHQFLPSFESNAGEPHVLDFPKGPFVDELIEVLQYIESIGSFYVNLRKIEWENTELEWIPETENEREQIRVNNIKWRRSYPESDTIFHSSLMDAMFAHWKNRSDLVIPIAFFREGLSEHKQFRHIQSFYNFYFVLEGLYGNGKVNNSHVEKEFLESSQLYQATVKALENIDKDESPRHRDAIQGWLARRGWAPSVPNVLKLLVRMRGDLHHFSLSKKDGVGHPLNQDEYEGLSYLSMSICTFAVAAILERPTSSKRKSLWSTNN